MMAKKECLYPNCRRLICLDKYQLHLSFCRTRMSSKCTRCPYNSLHMVPEEELAYHFADCSDRENAERFEKLLAQSVRVSSSGGTERKVERVKKLIEIITTDYLFPHEKEEVKNVNDLFVPMQISNAI